MASTNGRCSRQSVEAGMNPYATAAVWMGLAFRRPLAAAFRFPSREGMYTTLLMSTGLTFGTISALFGLTHGVIDQSKYTVLVTVVILSAFVPTLVAQQFYKPDREAHLARDRAAAAARESAARD
jgi:Kef-type K+ transport system membrane component KefB